MSFCTGYYDVAEDTSIAAHAPAIPKARIEVAERAVPSLRRRKRARGRFLLGHLKAAFSCPQKSSEGLVEVVLTSGSQRWTLLLTC